MSRGIAANWRSDMSSAVLGLDIGSNSIGWALIDEEGGVLLATGVRVFPEGVDRDKQGGEVSRMEGRRIARGMRRQVARRARRKRNLRRVLVDAGLWFDDANAEAAWLHDAAHDPYELRRRALSERLDPFEVGRVLIHLNQRRGFLSNRKSDKAKKKEASEMLKEIAGLQQEVEQAGHRTLGEYLAALRSADAWGGLGVRVRGRHTQRAMLRHEFNAVWDRQTQFHPDLLTEDLRKRLDDERADEDWVHHGEIFGQRRMYWPKSVVGACELEPKRKRCPRADRLAQRFRLLQEVGNLRVIEPGAWEERPLTADERATLITLLERKKEEKFDDIRKKLKLHEHARFNLERGERKKLDGMATDCTLAHKDVFGKAWYNRSEDEKNAIVRALLNEKLEEADIRRRAAEEWGLPADRVDTLIDVALPEGYASYSREALEKLLPHLERGLPLSAADDVPCALREAGYLRPDQRVVGQRDDLPPPPDITNPLVRQALHEVRRLINAIIREYGKPARIHLELTREVKGTAEKRAQQTREMREREQRRSHAADEIRALGHRVSADAIDQYLLWEEQNHVCVYSGRPISQAHLLTAEVNVDHILPRHRSLDNSLMNKVLCYRDENAAKGDRTPYEWLAGSQPAKFEQVLQRARNLPWGKMLKFRQQDISLDDFVARQLNDTAYITRTVRSYLECLGVDVVCTKGQLTYDLRLHWGLNEVLRHDNLNLKNREDHRHHAVDAIVIALTTRSRMHRLAQLYRPKGMPADALPAPWERFRTDVETAVNAINVSHRVRRRVRGQLHEETIYGPTQKLPDRPRPRDERPWAKDWIEEQGHYVYRKPLEALTLAMIDDIRDPTIRQNVVERLAQFGLQPGQKGNIPKEVWKEPLCMPSGIPIKKVRLVKKEGTIQPIRDGKAWVKPGDIHHVCLFELPDSRGAVRRDLVCVSLIEAAARRRDRQSIINRTHPTLPTARFLMSLSSNELLLISHEGRENLYRFVTAASTSKQMWFKQHTVAGPAAEKTGVISKKPNTLQARKVTVDALGRIRDAHD